MSNTAFTEGNRVGANNIVFEGNPAPANIFANLEALRLSPDAAAVAGTMEILSHVPIRKPNRHEFFRTRPEPEMWFDTGVFEDKEERETFFVTPAMREALVGEIRPVLLVPTMTRQSVLLLWPLRRRRLGRRPNSPRRGGCGSRPTWALAATASIKPRASCPNRCGRTNH